MYFVIVDIKKEFALNKQIEHTSFGHTNFKNFLIRIRLEENKENK